MLSGIPKSVMFVTVSRGDTADVGHVGSSSMPVCWWTATAVCSVCKTPGACSKTDDPRADSAGMQKLRIYLICRA
jgi:hypothetical protein